MSVELLCKAHLFKPSGKWKYEVTLDYRGLYDEEGKQVTMPYQSPNDMALLALYQATENGISGVILREPGEYALVCVDPPNGFPVLVQGTTTLWRTDEH